MRRAAAVVGIPLLAAGLAAAAPARPAAGDLDRAFGRGGVAVLAMGDATGPGGLARRDDGEIVLLGAVRCGIECQDLTLLALAPDGRARLRGGARFAASTVPAAALALGAGRLAAAGDLSSQTLGGGPGAMRFDLGLRPDPGFAGGAAVVARVPAPALLSRFTSVVAPPDGRVVGAGDCRRALPAGGTAGCLLLVGLTPAGDPDLAFGAAATPGATISAVTRGGTPARTVRAGAALRLPDGRIVQGATVGFGGGRRVAVARYRASGIPDPAWGAGGLRVTDIPGSRSEGASAVAADGAGRIVAAGAAAVGGRRRIALVGTGRAVPWTPRSGAGGSRRRTSRGSRARRRWPSWPAATAGYGSPARPASAAATA